MRSPGRHRRSKRAPSLPRVGMALAVAVALLFIAPASTGGAQVLPPPRFRDVADQLPFETDVHSWDIDVGRLDADAVPDVVISYHGFIVFYRLIRPSFVRVFRRPGNDPHACAIGDVDDDGMGDVLCTRGAALGTIRKRNHLWMQTHPGRFRDRAGRYGVRDPLGRGRHATFIDLNHDAYPDLFIGNEFPRADGLRSPNRTYLNSGGRAFREVRIGATHQRGAACVQAVDQDRDGWQDLLLCGQKRLYLYRSRRGPNGERRLRDVAPHLGIDLPLVTSALIADLDADGRRISSRSRPADSWSSPDGAEEGSRRRGCSPR